MIRRTAKTDKFTFSVDSLMTNLSLALVRDFQSNFDDPFFCCDLHTALRMSDLSRIREAASALPEESDIARFKARHQLQSVLKRYRYQSDIYSDDELKEAARKQFLDTQDRLATIDLTTLPAISQRVLDRAASYIAKTLGVYSDEEHRNLCRFGSGATVGVPARLACLAARWEPPMSGSHEQISWFDSEMSQIPSIREYWLSRKDSDSQESIYRETSSLTLTLVPKTFKSFRVIMPNTTIGSYMSYGLGEMIRKRLKRVGYDIKSLQMRHRYLARQGSIHGLYATADLSQASDSITVALVERLFPRDWFEILNKARIANVQVSDFTCIESKTFCTMGIGYTFPLQTLVFLALLKAIESIMFHRFDRRTISVYGDDMIYSPRMHEHVVRFFTEFGFVINLDKTFHEGHFRESCGGDYYHGVDVRPFQPRNGSASVGRTAYEAILYKCINGLLMRWTEYEIGTTLEYLTSELEKIAKVAKIVPSDFPDDAGIKCSLPMSHDFMRHVKYASPKHIGHGLFRFSYLRFLPKERKETRHEPYLWEALHGDRRPASDRSWEGHRQEARFTLSEVIDERVGVRAECTQLRWAVCKPIISTRSKLTGRRLRRMESCVTISHTGSYKRRSGTSGFEDRR